MILIKNGRLIDPLSKRDEIVDIAIENEVLVIKRGKKKNYIGVIKQFIIKKLLK